MYGRLMFVGCAASELHASSIRSLARKALLARNFTARSARDEICDIVSLNRTAPSLLLRTIKMGNWHIPITSLLSALLRCLLRV